MMVGTLSADQQLQGLGILLVRLQW